VGQFDIPNERERRRFMPVITVAIGLLLVIFQAPQQRIWEVVRSADGDFAFSMPSKPSPASTPVSSPSQRSGTDGEHVDYDCQVEGSYYHVRRTMMPAAAATRATIAQLARIRQGYLQGNAQLLKETKIVLDGVPGNDLTYSLPGVHGTGRVSKRVRCYLKDRYFYELLVASPAGQPLPADSTRFLSSLTFEALIKAHYAVLRSRQPAAATGRPARPASTSAAMPKNAGYGAKFALELADSTPEVALKTFLLALAAQDERKLREITLPNKEFDWLLKGRPAPASFLAEMKKQLDGTPIRRLAAGDRVTMPGNRKGTIQPSDVREGRSVLLPQGAPFPTRLQEENGHWRVFAGPFITARKLAESESGKR
jgi:hypothetical protein